MSPEDRLAYISEKESWTGDTERMILLWFLDHLIEEGIINGDQFSDYLENQRCDPSLD